MSLDQRVEALEKRIDHLDDCVERLIGRDDTPDTWQEYLKATGRWFAGIIGTVAAAIIIFKLGVH
jgi:hypothetical protein